MRHDLEAGVRTTLESVLLDLVGVNDLPLPIALAADDSVGVGPRLLAPCHRRNLELILAVNENRVRTEHHDLAREPLQFDLLAPLVRALCQLSKRLKTGIDMTSFEDEAEVLTLFKASEGSFDVATLGSLGPSITEADGSAL